MTYYVGTMPVGEHLSHYGVKGMRWYQRRYQNPDGSLTAAGKVRYGVSSAYSRARSGVRSAGNRAGSWYKKNKKTIKRVAAVAGTAAAVAGTAYLGKRYGKNAVKAVRKAGSQFGNLYNAHRVRFPQKALPGAVKGSKFKSAFKSAGSAVRSGFGNVKRSASNAIIRSRQNWYASKAARADARAAAKSTLSLNNGFRNKTNRTFGKAGSAVGGFARKAAGATGDAFRGIGYHTRRAGAKAKNAARNLGYMAGNVKGNAKRAASKAGTAAKNAAYKAKTGAKYAASSASSRAKNVGGNAKRVAYNLKNNKAYRTAAAIRGTGKVLSGVSYYTAARRYGASKKQAAAIGGARAVGGKRAGMATAAGIAAVSAGKKVAKGVKAYNSPRAKRARANYRKRKNAKK